MRTVLGLYVTFSVVLQCFGAPAVPLATFRGCLTWSKAEAYVSAVVRSLPGRSRTEELGRSVQSRPLTGLCLGELCDVVGGRKEDVAAEVFLNAMHHSRECVSMMALVMWVDRFVKAVEINEPWAEFLMKTRRIWVLFVVNPDGYVYNEKQWRENPNQLRTFMQRKNRQQDDCGTNNLQGVDLNRNYATCFFNDDKINPRTRGASLKPCDEDYQGKQPFSEPETRAIKDFVGRSNFTVALNFHSFGKFLLLPWSCGTREMSEEESKFYLALGADLVEENHYTRGHSFKMIGYAVDGDAADWMYDAHNIYAMSPEVGPHDDWVNAKRGRDGFWPDEDIVEDLASENIQMITKASLASGALLELDAVELSGLELTIAVVNTGLWHSFGDVRVRIKANKWFTPPAATLGKLDFKYSGGQVSFTLPENCTSANLEIVIFDEQGCVTYSQRADSMFSWTASNAFADRFLATDPQCSFQQNDVPRSPPPGEDTKGKSKSWFFELSIFVKSHQLLVLFLLTMLSGCYCYITVMRTGNQASGYRAVERDSPV